MVKPVDAHVPQKYRFFPGDELSVSAVGRPELSVTATRVGPDGYISYPYLGQVRVKGLTAQEVAERLTWGLKEGNYYKRVALTVSFIASGQQYVYVLGEVQKPGPIAIAGSVSLLDAIGGAGGQTYDAEMSTVLWIRGSQTPPGVVRLNLSALGSPYSSNPSIPHLMLIPGDVIYVPDSPIASVQRFMNRMFDIFRPVVDLGTGVVLYQGLLQNRYPNGGGTAIIVSPGGK